MYVAVEARNASFDVAVPLGGRDEECDVPLVIAGAQANGVDAASQGLRNHVVEVGLPAGVVVVVVVEMDRAVLMQEQRGANSARRYSS